MPEKVQKGLNQVGNGDLGDAVQTLGELAGAVYECAGQVIGSGDQSSGSNDPGCPSAGKEGLHNEVSGHGNQGLEIHDASAEVSLE